MSDTLTKQSALDTIGRFRALKGTLPDPVRLAVKFQVPVAEAQEWIDAFKPEPNTRPRKSAPKAQEMTPAAVKVTAAQKIGHFFENMIDSGSLWMAVGVDLVLNGIGFWIIGPEPVMKVGMVCVSVIVVLFSVRAWIKHDKLLWAMFALVASFMDISFILTATEVQSENAGVDTELIRLTKLVDDDVQYLQSLQSLQITKGEGYATQIQNAQLTLDKDKLARTQWLNTAKSGGISISASKVFTAIPDAVFSGRWDRWIALGIMFFVFIGLQLTIISATGVKWNEQSNHPKV